MWRASHQTLRKQPATLTLRCLSQSKATTGPPGAEWSSQIAATEKEYENYVTIEKAGFTKNYQEYVTHLPELQNTCSQAVDLRGLFDDVLEPIYFDKRHTGPLGNQIIAQEFFHLSLPELMKKSENINLNENYQESIIQEIEKRVIAHGLPRAAK